MDYKIIFLLKKNNKKNKKKKKKKTHKKKQKNTNTFFFQQNTCELHIVLTRTVNILAINELVKLIMLWRTGPWNFMDRARIRSRNPRRPCQV